MFGWLQGLMAGNVGFFSFLPPEALGIVAFHMAAEFTAGLAAAGALIADSGLTEAQVVLALMLGNVLSSPHAGIPPPVPVLCRHFKPRMAMKLIVCNQVLRAVSIAVVGTVYAVFA